MKKKFAPTDEVIDKVNEKPKENVEDVMHPILSTDYREYQLKNISKF